MRFRARRTSKIFLINSWKAVLLAGPDRAGEWSTRLLVDEAFRVHVTFFLGNGFGWCSIWFSATSVSASFIMVIFLLERQRAPRRRSAHSAAQVRHKCGTSAAQVRHKCGTSAAQVRHKCGTSAAQVRHKCGTSAAQVRHKCGTSAEQVRSTVRIACGTPADVRRGVFWQKQPPPKTCFIIIFYFI